MLRTLGADNGLDAVMFDVKNFAMLSGFVLVAHQFGSFLGGRLDGPLYDRTGTYTLGESSGLSRRG